MSTFGGTIKEIPGISIDRFDGDNVHSRAFFLSHCHSDHMKGLDKLSNFLKKDGAKYIYMSKISAVIIQEKYPDLLKFLKPLEIDENNLIRIPGDDLDQYVNVVLISAGHCPGSVMFMFDKPDETAILYTGDFRTNLKSLRKIKPLHNSDGVPRIFDKVYFDSTFWNDDYMDFPSRRESCVVLCNMIKMWISKGSEYVVSLDIPAWFGSEYLYQEIYTALNIPIHVNNATYAVYSRVKDIELAVTMNPKDTQIHSCFTTLSCAKSHIGCMNTDGLKISHIRPSALIWKNWKKGSDVFLDNNNRINVCYSSHCSYNELKDFLSYLKPKAVVPCVVPEKSEFFFQSLNEFCMDYSTSVTSSNDLSEQYKIGISTTDDVFVNLLSDSDDETSTKDREINYFKTNSFKFIDGQPITSNNKKKIKLF